MNHLTICGLYPDAAADTLPRVFREPVMFGRLLVAAVEHMRHGAIYFQPDFFRPDDILLASYPRSGNHLARFALLCGRCLSETGDLPADLSGMARIPGVHGQRIGSADARPRILKTHYPFDPRAPRVIHLIRDPRDVLVSYFHYVQNLPHLFMPPSSPTDRLSDFADAFMAGHVWPGEVAAHTRSFEDRAPQRLCIRYEDLLNDPETQFGRMLAYVGIQLAAPDLRRIAAHCSFENMARLHDPATARRGGVSTRREMILRKGRAGGHRADLPPDVHARVTEHYRRYLLDHGYEP